MSQKFVKNLLITGANRGLGLEFVKKLASRVDILFAGCHVTCEKSIQACIEEVSKVCGEVGLSCLINNAGAIKKPDNKVTELSLDDLKRIFSVNTFGPSIVCKSSLNMFTKMLSLELKQDDIGVICINPGWVQTELGGWNATLTVEQSVDQMLKTLSILKPDQMGSLIDIDGSIIPY
ncbi:uncharacterized protein [Clytia hemisphaerica]|uniref:uncharacterized protein n=1 Tax=Clytia hemisphaerica TaxID=252671 RepID=UPI0034D44DF8